MSKITDMLERAASRQGRVDESLLPALMEAAEEYEQLKQQVGDLEAQLKALKERQRELGEIVIPDMMQTANMVSPDGKGSLSLASGGKIYLKTDVFINVRKEDKEKLLRWLRRAGMGALIREDVHHQTLKATIKELIENDEQLPSFVTTYPVTSTVYMKPSR